MFSKSSIAVIVYKLSAELLLLVLFGCILFLLAEIILPGFVSSRINFSYAYMAIIICLSFLIFSRQFLPQTALSSPTSSRRFPIWMFGLSIVGLTLLFVNDMHGLSYFQATCILLSLAIFLFFFLPTVLRKD